MGIIGYGASSSVQLFLFTHGIQKTQFNQKHGPSLLFSEESSSPRAEKFTNAFCSMLACAMDSIGLTAGILFVCLKCIRIIVTLIAMLISFLR